MKSGQNPRQIKQAKATQTAKLLTILVEFNPNANDDFSGVQVPATVFGDRTCVQGGIQNGPLHNQIPNPADAVVPGQQHVLGRRLQPGALRPDAVHLGGDHRARPPGPHRSRRPAWGRHLRVHDAEPLPRDVQGRLHRRRRRHAVGPGAPLGGLVRRRPLHAERRRARWRPVRRSARSATRTTRRAPDSSPSTPSTPLMTEHPDFPLRRLRHRGPGRLATATATCSSRTASSTTSCWSTPARTSRAAAAPRASYAIWAHSSTVVGGVRDPQHRDAGPRASQLHRAARGLGRGCVLARVRPRPRAPGPVRHERRRRLAHRVLGPA